MPTVLLYDVALAFPASRADHDRQSAFEIRRTSIAGPGARTLAPPGWAGVAGGPAAPPPAPGSGADLATAATTLLIAALVKPLRRSLQDFVDHRSFRPNADAARTPARFSAHARDEVELDGLSAHLLGVVQETMQPAQVSLWLSPVAGAVSGRASEVKP